MGHLLPMHSAPEPNNVRCAPNSVQNIAARRMTRSANSGHSVRHPRRLKLTNEKPRDIARSVVIFTKDQIDTDSLLRSHWSRPIRH